MNRKEADMLISSLGLSLDLYDNAMSISGNNKWIEYHDLFSKFTYIRYLYIKVHDGYTLVSCGPKDDIEDLKDVLTAVLHNIYADDEPNLIIRDTEVLHEFIDWEKNDVLNYLSYIQEVIKEDV